jgi:hypothetical protein
MMGRVCRLSPSSLLIPLLCRSSSSSPPSRPLSLSLLSAVFIHELSDSLAQLTSTEKSDLLIVLEREAKREKNIDSRVKEQKLKERQALKADPSQQKLAAPGTPGSAARLPEGADKEGAGLGLMGQQTAAAMEKAAAAKGDQSASTAELAEKGKEAAEVDESALGEIEKEFFEILGMATDQPPPADAPAADDAPAAPPADAAPADAEPADAEPAETPPAEEPAAEEEGEENVGFLRKVARAVDERTDAGLEAKLDEAIDGK